MSTEKKLEEVGKELAGRARHALESAGEAFDEAKEKTEELYETAKSKSCGTCHRLEDAVREKPLPVIAGALAFGIAIGYLIASSRRSYGLSDHLRDSVHDAWADARDRVPDAVSARLQQAGKSLKFW